MRLSPSNWHGATRADECHNQVFARRGFDSPGGSATKIFENMETTLYIIIAAIVLAMGWIVWAVIEEGRPELPKDDNNETR